MCAQLLKLPPCAQLLKLHCSRANYVSRMWRYAFSLKLDLESSTLHVWNEDLSQKWIEEAYPDNITEILVKSRDDEEIPELEIDDIDINIELEEACARINVNMDLDDTSNHIQY